MPTTPLLGLVYPGQGEEPNFVTQERLYTDIDFKVYLNREDRNWLMVNPGTWTYTIFLGNGFLSHSMELWFVNGVTGFKVTVPGGITVTKPIPDGGYLWVEVPRHLTSADFVATAAEVDSGLVVGEKDSRIVIAFRRGNFLMLRNGQILPVFSGTVTPAVALNRYEENFTATGIFGLDQDFFVVTKVPFSITAGHVNVYRNGVREAVANVTSGGLFQINVAWSVAGVPVFGDIISIEYDSDS